MSDYCVVSVGSKILVSEWDTEACRTAHSGRELDEVRTEYPDAQVMSFDAGFAAMEAAFVSEPQEVTEHYFTDMLNVLPPHRWYRDPGAEAFAMCERSFGSITRWLVRVGTSYYSFEDRVTLSHREVFEKVMVTHARLYPSS